MNSTPDPYLDVLSYRALIAEKHDHRVLTMLLRSSGLTKKELITATVLGKRSLERALARLKTKGHVASHRVGDTAKYIVTQEGRATLIP